MYNLFLQMYVVGLGSNVMTPSFTWEGAGVSLVTEAELVALVFRTTDASGSGIESMKVISGPATTVWFWRSTTFVFSGWLSDVIKIATGPLIPSGTTHWSIGKERVAFAPPVSI